MSIAPFVRRVEQFIEQHVRDDIAVADLPSCGSRRRGASGGPTLQRERSEVIDRSLRVIRGYRAGRQRALRDNDWRPPAPVTLPRIKSPAGFEHYPTVLIQGGLTQTRNAGLIGEFPIFRRWSLG
jgi:hypothetical protein